MNNLRIMCKNKDCKFWCVYGRFETTNNDVVIDNCTKFADESPMIVIDSEGKCQEFILK
jgi:hypothetical protein